MSAVSSMRALARARDSTALPEVDLTVSSVPESLEAISSALVAASLMLPESELSEPLTLAS